MAFVTFPIREKGRNNHWIVECHVQGTEEDWPDWCDYRDTPSGREWTPKGGILTEPDGTMWHRMPLPGDVTSTTRAKAMREANKRQAGMSRPVRCRNTWTGDIIMTAIL